MALHLNQVPDCTIQILGRWFLDTFLIYTHQQIAAFSHNLSTIVPTHIIYDSTHINPTLRTTGWQSTQLPQPHFSLMEHSSWAAEDATKLE
jgi:hypothetical protein